MKKNYKQNSNQKNNPGDYYKYWYFGLFIVAVIAAVLITTLINRSSSTGEAITLSPELFKSAPSFKFIEADSIAPRSGNTLCKDNGYSKCLNAFRLVLVYNYDSTNAQCGGSTQSINRYIEPVSCSYEESNLFTTCQGNAAPPGKTYVEPLKGDSNSQGRIMQAICYN